MSAPEMLPVLDDPPKNGIWADGEITMTVLAMTGWRRDLWFDQTGLPWIPTSPVLPGLMPAAEGTDLRSPRSQP